MIQEGQALLANQSVADLRTYIESLGHNADLANLKTALNLIISETGTHDAPTNEFSDFQATVIGTVLTHLTLISAAPTALAKLTLLADFDRKMAEHFPPQSAGATTNSGALHGAAWGSWIGAAFSVKMPMRTNSEGDSCGADENYSLMAGALIGSAVGYMAGAAIGYTINSTANMFCHVLYNPMVTVKNEIRTCLDNGISIPSPTMRSSA